MALDGLLDGKLKVCTTFCYLLCWKLQFIESICAANI
jgi:hypothetical protein